MLQKNGQKDVAPFRRAVGLSWRSAIVVLNP